MLAPLCRCACQASAANLTDLPMVPAKWVKAELRTVMQHRLCILPLTSNMFGIRCQCTAPTLADDSNHAMTYTSMQGKATVCHDILERILRRTIHCAGVVSTLEPKLRALPGLDASACSGAAGAEIADLEVCGESGSPWNPACLPWMCLSRTPWALRSGRQRR
jgi:hypothetical protein